MSEKCRLRHIAIAVRDPEAMAKFFEEAFGMTRAANARAGVYMTDGVMNVALLQYSEERPALGFEDQLDFLGVTHFGLWVDDLDKVAEKATKAGGRYLQGRKDANPDAFYEVKFATPEGVVFDLTENGWKGAAKDVTPEPVAQPAE